jgi:DNA invertase Pin-like site-specific DNA recombinase
MLSVFSEFETNLRRERQMDGIKIAKEKGKFKGGVAKIDVKKIQSLKSEGLGATEIAKQMGIDRTSVYRLLKKVKVSA